MANDKKSTPNALTVAAKPVTGLATVADFGGIAMPEGFGLLDFVPIKLERDWFKPEPRAGFAAFPLRRSGNVARLFATDEDREKEARGIPIRDKRVFAAELCAPAVLTRNKEPVQGEAGDLFYFFAPSYSAVCDAIIAAMQQGRPLFVGWVGKAPTFSRALNRKTDMWQYRVMACKTEHKRVHDPNAVIMPQADGGEFDAPSEVIDA